MLDPLAHVGTVNHWIATHLWLVGGGVAGLILLAWLVGRVQWGVPQTTHGSARWATGTEIRRAGLVTQQGVVLGRWGTWVLRSPQGHVLVCMPTGSGKDVGINFPTTMRYPHSMIIFDPKDGGENYLHFARHRGRKGWPVYSFAPTMTRSHGINLLDFVRWGKPEEFRDVDILSASHLAPMTRNEMKSEEAQYWASQGKAVLRAATLHVGHTDPQRSYARVRAFLSDEHTCIQGLRQSPHPIAREVGAELATTADKERSGFLNNARIALNIYQDPLIAQHTARTDIPLMRLQYGAQPMTLYIRANAMAEIDYIAPLLRAVLELTLHRLEGAPRQYESRRRELLWLLNECPRLGYMALIEQAPAEVRSYKMRFLINCQDISQMQRAFGYDTPLLANCKTQVFAGTQHDETVALLSRRLDNTTVRWRSVTQGRAGKSVAEHHGARRLLTEAEVRGLSSEALVVWAEDCPAPILATKLRYYRDRF